MDDEQDRAKPNHPLARPIRSERPNSRPYLQTFRTELRKRLTPAEATLWRSLKGSRLDGRKFRRQHSVGSYILDFYCPAERLAVELDGQVHRNESAEVYDRERKLFLEYYGIKVIPFENFLVFDELEYVLHRRRQFFGWWEREGRTAEIRIKSFLLELPPLSPSAATPPAQAAELLQ